MELQTSPFLYADWLGYSVSYTLIPSRVGHRVYKGYIPGYSVKNTLSSYELTRDIALYVRRLAPLTLHSFTDGL